MAFGIERPLAICELYDATLASLLPALNLSNLLITWWLAHFDWYALKFFTLMKKAPFASFTLRFRFCQVAVTAHEERSQIWNQTFETSRNFAWAFISHGASPYAPRLSLRLYHVAAAHFQLRFWRKLIQHSLEGKWGHSRYRLISYEWRAPWVGYFHFDVLSYFGHGNANEFRHRCRT